MVGANSFIGWGLLTLLTLLRNNWQPREPWGAPCATRKFGKHLLFGADDGKLYATASRAVNKTALFRVMVLSRPMVDMLADAMRTTNVAKWSHRKMSTKSGCKCSGFSAPPSAASSRRPPPPPSPVQSRV